MSDETLELTIEEATSTTEEEVTGDVWELTIETGERGPAGPPGSGGGDHGDLTGLTDPDHPSTAITVPADTLSAIDPDLIYDDVYDHAITLGASAPLAAGVAASAASYISAQPSTVQQALINSAELIGPLLAASAIALSHASDAISGFIVDAKGDLIVATADNTVTRLAVGTDGKVLTADSAETTGLKWATPSPAGIPLATIDAKGDLLAGTADDTATRIAVGANGTVLTADSAETTGLKWANPHFRVTPSTGDVLSAQGTSASSAYSVTVNSMFLHPIWLGAGTLDRLGVYHTLNNTSTWRVSLYRTSPTTGLPVGQALELDAGVIDLSTGATGFNWLTISHAITEGMYWAAVQGVTYTAPAPSTHVLAYNHTGLQPLYGAPVNTSSVGRSQVGIFVLAASTAAPTTLPSTSFSWFGTVPRVFARYA